MKRTLAIVLALIMALALVGCAKPGENSGKKDGGTFDATIWVAEAAVELTQKQIDKFNAENEDGIKINAKIQPVSEADAGTNMITDVEAGGDIFCFAQDQFARLVQAGALSKLGVAAAETVKNSNDAGAVAAATIGEDLMAYPLTADNGYFMYYDKSVIPDADVDSLEKLIADCEAANKFFEMELNSSAWYAASFFFATGCKSEWVTDSDGSYKSVNDTFKSPEGLIAVKGMKKLVDSDIHVNASKTADFDSGAAVVVSGTWDFETAKGILGDNLGVADLPSFEVDGKEYHLGSYAGYKLLGVKPQQDANKAAALHKLAQYLTGEECQMERFNELSWGPANKNDQASDAVKANVALAALIQQAPYSVLQGQIHGSWWDIAKVIADDVKAATDDAGLQAALDNYYDKISALFEMSDDAKNAWGVIGTCNSTDGFFYIADYDSETRSNWAEDIPMEEISEGVWRTKQAWDMEAGCEFKVRQGANWDVAFPAENFKVETAGKYYVEFNTATEELTLVPAE